MGGSGMEHNKGHLTFVIPFLGGRGQKSPSPEELLVVGYSIQGTKAAIVGLW